MMNDIITLQISYRNIFSKVTTITALNLLDLNGYIIISKIFGPPFYLISSLDDVKCKRALLQKISSFLFEISEITLHY